MSLRKVNALNVIYYWNCDSRKNTEYLPMHALEIDMKLLETKG